MLKVTIVSCHMEERPAQHSMGKNNQQSFRDTLLGWKTTGLQTEYEEEDGNISEDEGVGEEEDEEGCPNIIVSTEEKIRLRKPWRHTLIVKVMGRQIGYNYLLRRIKTLWKPKACLELVAIENDYFIAKFASNDDYEFAKYEGPWLILDHYLIVKEWTPNFDPFAEHTEKILAWVRFPCLPIEYYDKTFLMKIGEKIGKPVKVDQATSLVSRGKFARICVEVDITKPLLAKFKIRQRVIKIEYEGIHLVCFKCGVYGHRKDACPTEKPKDFHDETKEEERQLAEEQIRQARFLAESKEPFGPWMLVSRANRKQDKIKESRGMRFGKQDYRTGLDSNQVYAPKKYNTRYELLAEEDHIEMDPIRTDQNKNGPENAQDQPVKKGTREGRGRRPNVQINSKTEILREHPSEKQGTKTAEINTDGVTTQSRSNTREHNRAAEAEEHTLVRGTQGGKIIFRETINNEVNTEFINNYKLFSQNGIYEHYQDPPESAFNKNEELYMEEDRENEDEEMIKETPWEELVVNVGPSNGNDRRWGN